MTRTSPITLLRRSAAVVSIACLAVSSASYAQSMSKEEARKIVTPLYTMLNQPQTKDLNALSAAAFTPDWKSCSSPTECQGREAFVGKIGYFGKLVPDLKWEIKEVLVDGNRVTVIGEGSGTPADTFFGVPASGKSFKIMSIDVHTIQNGKLAAIYHVEDWASALQQLSAK